MCWRFPTLLLVFFVAFVSRAECGDPAAVLPDDARLENVKSPAEFFGFEIGSRHLRHAQVADYWRYLASESSRVRLIEYGKTHGSRPLLIAAISSEENIANLSKLQKSRQKITRADQNEDLSSRKLVMYMGYSVHGDESSAVNAAPLVAYHLASSKSADTLAWLEQSVFLVDPAINPDGVDRFANWANENRGRFPSPSSLDREHNQPWPGGRTNYYWFDLNRDWLPLTHPESRGRLKVFHSWKPNVVLDFHEMSGNSSFFFQPGIPTRNNPLSPAKNLELTRKFAVEHADAMDDAGELYFTEERFDDFYVGKGSTYPDLHGAVGILFEQGSTRGLRLVNDRTNRHFRDTVANQVRTSLSSLRAANRHRTELINFQHDFYAQASDWAKEQNVAAYILHGTPSRIAAAANLLAQHDIRGLRTSETIELEGQTLQPENTLIIPTEQPESTFIRSLMEPLQTFRENIFYDVSTWHLPSAFDLDTTTVAKLDEAWQLEPFSQRKKTRNDAKTQADDFAGICFSAIELSSPILVAQAQRLGAHVRVATTSFEIESDGLRAWPAGTFLLLKQPNQAIWKKLVTLTRRTCTSGQIEYQELQTGITKTGPDLGSDTTLDLPICNPLLVVGDGTRSYSAGAIWHHMDVRLGQPTTMIEAARIGNVDLVDFTCVILPEGSYSNVTERAVERLKRYAENGGTIIATGSSISWLGRQDLIALGGQPKSNIKSVSSIFGNARNERALESIAGAFFETEIDQTHPLAYGFPNNLVPTFRDHKTVFSLPSNPYKVAGKYTKVLAGYVSQANRQKLKQTAAAWVEPIGRGRAILLADNPVFRGYVRSGERFFTNALYIGPAISIPSQSAEEENVEEGH